MVHYPATAPHQESAVAVQQVKDLGEISEAKDLGVRYLPTPRPPPRLSAKSGRKNSVGSWPIPPAATPHPISPVSSRQNLNMTSGFSGYTMSLRFKQGQTRQGFCSTVAPSVEQTPSNLLSIPASSDLPSCLVRTSPMECRSDSYEELR
ncbi:MAG: hypothetical protein HC851_03520 [Acaryochloris sp. RU_4_1]|nr:hypothetical protein [Acaryochloris sp. RU_4_1]